METNAPAIQSEYYAYKARANLKSVQAKDNYSISFGQRSVDQLVEAIIAQMNR